MLVGATALRHCWGWAIQFLAVSAKFEVETMSNLEIILSQTIDGLQRGSEDILNRKAETFASPSVPSSGCDWGMRSSKTGEDTEKAEGTTS